MSLEIDAIKSSYAIMANGYYYAISGLNEGKESEESKKAKSEREIEEKKKVTPTYDVRGSLVNLLV